MRRFLSPKALGLAVVALVLMGVMTALGLWQLSVYDGRQHADSQAALNRATVPLALLLGPDSAFPSGGESRPVTASGHYLADEQVAIRDLPGSTHRYAIATPLVTPTGSAILVVRGSGSAPHAAAPGGTVHVEGLLEPSGAGGPPNRDRVAAGLSISSLVNAVRPDLYSGYVLLRSSTPAQRPPLTPVDPPLPEPSRWAGIRNLLYACQWWVFAGFVAFMWWRMTGDMVRPRRTEGAEALGAGALR